MIIEIVEFVKSFGLLYGEWKDGVVGKVIEFKFEELIFELLWWVFDKVVIFEIVIIWFLSLGDEMCLFVYF